MRPIVAPALVGLAGVAGCAGIALIQPDDGDTALCPSRALLGVDCPGCGCLRGLGALMRGRIGEALDHNVLLLAIVPTLILIYLAWTASVLGRTSAAHRMTRWRHAPGALLALASLVMAFTVVRNLPVGGFAEYLGSGLT